MLSFKNFLQVLLLCILLGFRTCAAEVKSQFTGCSDVIIPVTISANNMFIPIPSTGPVFNVSVLGTYNIGATYCIPQHDVHSRRDVLQILVHGATYDRQYWTGHGFQYPTYSWVAYASSQGYPTLSIDRLCNGISDHPDPTMVCQVNAQVEVIHQLIQLARSGHLPGAAASINFNKVIYVSHSLGSVIGNNNNVKYPSDADATILTGYGSTTNVAYLYATLFPPLAPACTVDSAKFGSLPGSYLEQASIEAQRQVFFWGNNTYNESLFQLDYSLRGTLSIGEAQSAAVQADATAPAYKNPVFVITGRHDATFCMTPLPDGTFDCGSSNSNVLSQTKNLYPNVASNHFGWYAPQNSGHCWQLFYDAYATFGVAHDWLDRQGF